jgi:hypothetical protein
MAEFEREMDQIKSRINIIPRQFQDSFKERIEKRVELYPDLKEKDRVQMISDLVESFIKAKGYLTNITGPRRIENNIGVIESEGIEKVIQEGLKDDKNVFATGDLLLSLRKWHKLKDDHKRLVLKSIPYSFFSAVDLIDFFTSQHQLQISDKVFSAIMACKAEELPYSFLDAVSQKTINRVLKHINKVFESDVSPQELNEKNCAPLLYTFNLKNCKIQDYTEHLPFFIRGWHTLNETEREEFLNAVVIGNRFHFKNISSEIKKRLGIPED